MIKYLLILLTFFSSEAYSQGFDWQVSTRHPYEITDLYIGVSSSFSYGAHTGDFPFLERDIVCCNYETGTGTGVQFGLASEYWYQNDLAFSVGLLYSNINSIYSTETTVLKKINPDLPAFNWITGYESDITLEYISIDMAVKKRIYNKLNLKAGVDLNFNIGSEELHKNVVIEPANIPFADGSFEKELTNGRVGDISTFLLGVSLGLSYDINLGVERYGEISLLTNYTVNSYINNNSWHSLQAKLTARAFLGIR